MDVSCDLIGGGHNLICLFYFNSEAMVMKMPLEPVVAMTSFRQETKVANFHNPVSRLIFIDFCRFLTFMSSLTLHVY